MVPGKGPALSKRSKSAGPVRLDQYAARRKRPAMRRPGRTWWPGQAVGDQRCAGRACL